MHSIQSRYALLSKKEVQIEETKNHFKVRIPDFDDEFQSLLSPLLMSIPAQLLAYHVAKERGTDVDQPRNLAKSVTVE